jgi:hypothetical protein
MTGAALTDSHYKMYIISGTRGWTSHAASIMDGMVQYLRHWCCITSLLGQR